MTFGSWLGQAEIAASASGYLSGGACGWRNMPSSRLAGALPRLATFKVASFDWKNIRRLGRSGEKAGAGGKFEADANFPTTHGVRT